MEADFASLLDGLQLGRGESPVLAHMQAVDKFDNDRLFGPAPPDLSRRDRLRRALDLAPPQSSVAAYARLVVGPEGYMHGLHAAPEGDQLARAFLDLPCGVLPTEAKAERARQRSFAQRRAETNDDEDKGKARRSDPNTKPRSNGNRAGNRKHDDAQHSPHSADAPPGLVGWLQPKAE